jgi:hypothetical protein
VKTLGIVSAAWTVIWTPVSERSNMLHGRIANPPSKRIHAFAPLFLREALRSSLPNRLELLNILGCARPYENTVSAPMLRADRPHDARTVTSESSSRPFTVRRIVNALHDGSSPAG